MKNKRNILLLVVLSVVVVALLAAYFLTRPGATYGPKEFTLTVVHSDGNSKTFTYQTREGYLGKALQDEGIISGEDGPYGLYIHEVDGERAVFEEDAAYWAFYEGEAYAMLGIDKTPIQHGAVYKLVYTKDTGFGG